MIYGINGSPRKHGNTAQSLHAFLEGVSASSHKQTKIIHLIDYDNKGCISCFGCKKNNDTYGSCVMKDDILKIIQLISKSDGIVFASPIYFGNITGQMQSFLERLLFPYNSYEKGWKKIAPKRMPTAFLYTMMVNQETMEKKGYPQSLRCIEQAIAEILNPPFIHYICNTHHRISYDHYKISAFSKEEKENSLKNFEIDLRNLYDKGYKFGMNI